MSGMSVTLTSMQHVEFIPVPLNDVKNYDSYNTGMKTIYNHKNKYVSVILSVAVGKLIIIDERLFRNAQEMSKDPTLADYV